MRNLLSSPEIEIENEMRPSGSPSTFSAEEFQSIWNQLDTDRDSWIDHMGFLTVYLYFMDEAPAWLFEAQRSAIQAQKDASTKKLRDVNTAVAESSAKVEDIMEEEASKNSLRGKAEEEEHEKRLERAMYAVQKVSL